MADVVCLVADPQRPARNGATVASLERALGGAARWLAPHEARELRVDDHDRAEIRVPIEAALSPELPHDIVVLPAARRRKGLVSDMDSTMITVECIDELADYLGVEPEVSAIPAVPWTTSFDFVAALRARVALLGGAGERVRLMPGARTLARTMRSWGARTA